MALSGCVCVCFLPCYLGATIIIKAATERERVVVVVGTSQDHSPPRRERATCVCVCVHTHTHSLQILLVGVCKQRTLPKGGGGARAAAAAFGERVVEFEGASARGLPRTATSKRRPLSLSASHSLPLQALSDTQRRGSLQQPPVLIATGSRRKRREAFAAFPTSPNSPNESRARSDPRGRRGGCPPHPPGL